MNDLLNSKFATDLKNGKLPPVEVEIETTSIFMLGGTILTVGAILLIGWFLLRK